MIDVILIVFYPTDSIENSSYQNVFVSGSCMGKNLVKTLRQHFQFLLPLNSSIQVFFFFFQVYSSPPLPLYTLYGSEKAQFKHSSFCVLNLIHPKLHKKGIDVRIHLSPTSVIWSRLAHMGKFRLSSDLFKPTNVSGAESNT